MKALILAFTLLLSFAASGKTIVILENKTSIRLPVSTTQSGYSLSHDHWEQLAQAVEPGTSAAILKFDRDSGIKSGKTFLFTTQVTSQVKLLQLLQGKSINSHMWQSLASGNKKVVWSDDREPKHVGVNIEGRNIRVTYQAIPDGTNDNIVYRFEELPQIDLGEEENKLSILNYNIYMRPIAVFKNGQLIRARLIPEVIKGNDVVNFSEAFDDDARNLLLKNIRKDYPYHTKVVGEDVGLKQDGGVFIASKWPIIEEDEYQFGELCFKDFEDCLSHKGIGYAKILKGSKFYHIFATHLQAGYTQKDKNVRRAQLHKLKDFIKSKNISKDEPVIMTGDFNIHRMELDEKEENFDVLEVVKDVLNPDMGLASGSDIQNNYALMLKILNASGIPHLGHKFSFDPSINKLAKSSEPPELVEHIMYSLDHQQPVFASQNLVLVKSERSWREFVWEDYINDLSDHFPVRAEFQF